MGWLTQFHVKSGTVESRRKAVAEIAATMPSGCLRMLAGALKDTDTEVRRIAAGGLSKQEDTDRVSYLLGALTDAEPAVVKAALPGLRGSKDPNVIPTVLPLLRHVDAGVRSASAQFLESMDWTPSTPQEDIWFMLGRGWYGQAVSKHRAAVLPAFSLFIEHSPYSLAAAAVRALGNLSDPAAIEPLWKALNSADPAVSVAAADALGRLGLKDALPALLEALNHTQGHVRLAGIEALLALGARDAAGAISAKLGDPAWEVRRAAAETLGALQARECVDDLHRCLQDSDDDVRESCALALGNLGDPRSIPFLVCALGDQASGVRRLAAAALSRINPDWISTPAARASAGQLRAALKAGNTQARNFAEPLLARLCEGSAAEEPAVSSTAPDSKVDRQKLATHLLVALLGATHRDLRQAAAESLGRLGDRRVESALLRAVTDRDEGVRIAVQEALLSLKGCHAA